MIQQLGWESLESRRAKFRLSMTYRIVHGLVAIPLDRYLQLIPRKTRECSHSFKLHEFRPTTDYQAASFFFQAPHLWNALPVHLAEAPSLPAFKSRLARYELPPPPLFPLGGELRVC